MDAADANLVTIVQLRVEALGQESRLDCFRLCASYDSVRE